MSLVKYGDAESINVIQPADVADEETKSKLDGLKEDLKDDSLNQDPK
jgi:hypothetical protein